MRASFFLFLFMHFVLLESCKTKPQKTDSSTTSQQQLSEKEKLDFSYLFFEGIKDKILGNLPQAQTKLQQAVRLDPRNAAAHFELSQIYAMAGNQDLARLSGELAVKFNPDNDWYKRSLVEIYESSGYRDKSIKLIEELAAKHPNNTDYLYQLGEAYIHSGRYEQALHIYERISAKEGQGKDLAIQKKNLYLRMKKPEKAQEEIQKLIREFPEEPDYRAILADVYLFDKQPEKALEQYNEILRIDPSNPGVRFSLADFYRSAGDNEKSFAELKLAFSNPAAQIELKLQVISSYFEITSTYQELKPQAYELCEALIRAHPEDVRPHAIYADFLFRDERYEEALVEYMKVLEEDKSRYTLWNQVLMVLNELKDFKKVLELSTEAIELFPQQPVLFLYKGVSAIQLKQYEKAVEVLIEGLLVTIENDLLSAQFNSSLGDCYHYLGKNAESDQAYENALKLNPADTYVMNNYAYYLSLRNANLTRARQLSEKCNALAPGNPSFQDTFAWVLFQLGEFELSATWIDKAIESGGGGNPTIIEHKGDILWKLGKKDEAVAYWKKARDLGAPGDKLNLKIMQETFVE